MAALPRRPLGPRRGLGWLGAGRTLLEGARNSLSEVERALAAARRAADGELGTLRVGFSWSARFETLPAIGQAFRDRYPEVELLTEEEQMAWLGRKALGGGFRVLGAQAVREGMVHGRKTDEHGRHGLTHLAVRFDGLLEVTEPARMLEAVRVGIGSGKGFGFGLLSLARGG